MPIRTFIGVPLPESYQELLKKRVQEWRPLFQSKMGWTKAGNWHITLKFLGDMETGLLEEIKQALNTVRFAPFTLQAGSAGVFPPPKEGGPIRPRVIWVGLQQGASEITALAKNVENKMAALGFDQENRPFSPHLTLARIKREQKDPWKERLAEIRQTQWPVIHIERFTLWKSDLTPAGPIYTPLVEVASSSD